MKKILLLILTICAIATGNAITATSSVGVEMSANDEYTHLGRVTTYVYAGEYIVQYAVREIYKNNSNGYMYVLQRYGDPIPVVNSSKREFRYAIHIGGNWEYFNL